MFIQAIAELENDTASTRNVCTNVWHFHTDEVDTPLGEVTGIRQILQTFYLAIEDFLSSNITGNVRIRCYDLEAPEPRIPMNDVTVTVTPGGDAPLPEELAVCATILATGVSGDARGRLRGRLYIGPLNVTTTSDETGDVRVAAGFRLPLAAAMQDVANNVGSSSTSALTLSVFSRADSGPQNPDGSWPNAGLLVGMRTATHGYVDNAFDIQRRRGLDPSVRTVWP